ncbi:hypothetical protein LTR95_009171 [Oleoguttula sp. CCFEE 5521]
MASGSGPRCEAEMPSTHPDYGDAEAIPDEAVPLKLEAVVLTSTAVRVDNTLAARLAPRAEDESARHQVGFPDEQHLDDTGNPEPVVVPMPLTVQHIAAAPAFFCPIPGCRKLRTYVNSKDCKRHAESHWVRYTCPSLGCFKAWSRLDHFRKHERTDENHGCGDLQCTHADDAVSIIDEWRALGCGFCWQVFAVQSQPNVPLHLSMHEMFGSYTKHVFEHVNGGLTRAQWKLSCVIWSLLHGSHLLDAWTALYSSQFRRLDLHPGPILEWEDGAAVGFIQRLQNGESGVILFESICASRTPQTSHPEINSNTDVNAPPWAPNVIETMATQISGHQEAVTGPNLPFTAVEPSAYTDFSSTWRSDYATSSPYPQTTSPNGRVSGVADLDGHRQSSDSATERPWAHADLYGESVAHAGTLFSDNSGAEMRRVAARWTDLATTSSPTGSFEGIDTVRRPVDVPTRGHRRDAIAARVSRIIQWPGRMVSPSHSSNASDLSLAKKRHRRELSWTEQFRHMSWSSTWSSGLWSGRQPTE